MEICERAARANGSKMVQAVIGPFPTIKLVRVGIRPRRIADIHCRGYADQLLIYSVRRNVTSKIVRKGAVIGTLTCGSNSDGRVSALQADCRGFESRLPLQGTRNTTSYVLFRSFLRRRLCAATHRRHFFVHESLLYI